VDVGVDVDVDVCVGVCVGSLWRLHVATQAGTTIAVLSDIHFSSIYSHISQDFLESVVAAVLLPLCCYLETSSVVVVCFQLTNL
jgi:hypothetical protein